MKSFHFVLVNSGTTKEPKWEMCSKHETWSSSNEAAQKLPNKSSWWRVEGTDKQVAKMIKLYNKGWRVADMKSVLKEAKIPAHYNGNKDYRDIHVSRPNSAKALKVLQDLGYSAYHTPGVLDVYGFSIQVTQWPSR